VLDRYVILQKFQVLFNYLTMPVEEVQKLAADPFIMSMNFNLTQEA
jgi:hypothetical protein